MEVTLLPLLVNSWHLGPVLSPGLRPAVRRPVVRTAVSTSGPPAKLVDLYRERLSGAGVRRSGVSQESSGSSETW